MGRNGRAQFFDDREKEIEYTILTTEAKARISIYGSEKIVKKLAEFIREHNETITEEGTELFAELVQTMREESIGRTNFVNKAEIKEVIGGGTQKKKLEQDNQIKGA